MAPLPDNLTARLFVDYTSGGTEHTTLIRLESSATSSDAATMYGLFTTATKAMMSPTDAFTGARFSAAGSNVSFPIAVSSVVGTASGGPFDPDKRANFISVTGRSADGRDAKIGLFTVWENPDIAGFRNDTPSGAEAAFVTWATTNAANLRSASDEQVIWNTYVNRGVSAYWQRKLRRL